MLLLRILLPVCRGCGHRMAATPVKAAHGNRIEAGLGLQSKWYRGVAQSGSASALGAEGRGFESLRPDHRSNNLEYIKSHSKLRCSEYCSGWLSFPLTPAVPAVYLCLAKIPSGHKMCPVPELGGHSGRGFRLRPGRRVIAKHDGSWQSAWRGLNRHTSPGDYPQFCSELIEGQAQAARS